MAYAPDPDGCSAWRSSAPRLAAARIPFIRRMWGPYPTLEGVPTNYVIDRRGIVRYAKARAFTLDDLNEILVPLLQEPAPEGAPPQ